MPINCSGTSGVPELPACTHLSLAPESGPQTFCPKVSSFLKLLFLFWAEAQVLYGFHFSLFSVLPFGQASWASRGLAAPAPALLMVSGCDSCRVPGSTSIHSPPIFSPLCSDGSCLLCSVSLSHASTSVPGFLQFASAQHWHECQVSASQTSPFKHSAESEFLFSLVKVWGRMIIIYSIAVYSFTWR